MSVEIKVPSVAESVTEGQVAEWLKAEGDWMPVDEPVVVLESEKATMEIPAPVSGILSKILKKAGEMVKVGETIGLMEAQPEPPRGKEDRSSKAAKAKKKERVQAEPPDDAEPVPTKKPKVMPAAERMLAEAGLKAEDVQATGPGGRLLKEDVMRHLEQTKDKPSAAERPAAAGDREEEVVPMSLLRRKIAQRLVEAQRTAAILTTFNEIDMGAVIELRNRYKEPYQEKFGIKLGFMSFFVKASVDALKRFPAINAEIRDQHIVYRNYYDIGVAVGGGKGLVVPVLRDADKMSFAEVELAISDLAQRAQENKLTPDELQGGTFTISNGGVYGSLLSTPILNPPQSGILGLHAIQERPVARSGQIVIRPMMYVALSYDHRIVDGREAVTFLRRIKETIEDPSRILLEI